MISAILDQRTRCFYSAVPKLISLKNNISFQYEYIKRGETVLLFLDVHRAIVLTGLTALPGTLLPSTQYYLLVAISGKAEYCGPSKMNNLNTFCCNISR